MTIHEQAAQLAQALLPCPFCGATAVIEMDDSLGYWIQCDSCIVTGPTYRDEHVAVEHWNRRAASKSAAAQDVVTGETAWLIEMRAEVEGNPKWLRYTEFHRDWPYEHRGQVWQWTTDANSAIRFSRKQDAEQVRDILISFCHLYVSTKSVRDIIATEHSWIAAAPAAQPQAEVPGWAWREAIVQLSGGVIVTDNYWIQVERRAREIAATRALGEAKY